MLGLILMQSAGPISIELELIGVWGSFHQHPPQPQDMNWDMSMVLNTMTSGISDGSAIQLWKTASNHVTEMIHKYWRNSNIVTVQNRQSATRTFLIFSNN